MKEKVEIEKVQSHKPDELSPVLVRFENGELEAFVKDDVRFSYWRQQNGNDNKFGAQVIVNKRCYEGLINQTNNDDLMDTFICIRNKNTNKMNIVPVDKVKLKSTIYHQLNQKQYPEISNELTRKILLKKFCGRAANKSLQNAEEMKVNIDIIEGDLKRKVEETSFDPSANGNEQNSNNEEYFNKIRPPYQADANAVSEIYSIEKILTTKLLKCLDEEAKTLYQTNLESIAIKSKYLLNCIQSIQKRSASAEVFLNLKLIIYMDCLQNLITSNKYSLKGMELSAISENVENDVRNRFSDPNAYKQRTIYTTEKAVCYFIVFALLISGKYEINADILCEELKCDRKKLLRYAQIVYALPKSRSHTLTLRLPRNVSVPNKYISKKRRF